MRQLKMVIASIVACATIPAGLAQSEVGAWILREQSQRDVGVIGTSLVSQDGRKEQFRARQFEFRPPGRLPYGERMHEGMRWGAVAMTRTTATGPVKRP